MKFNTKTVANALLTFSCLLWLSLTLTHEAQAMAQISLQNNTKYWVNLYIDGNFGCGPVMPSGFCTSSVKEGPHLLEARKGDVVVQKEEGVNIGDGTSPTWTVAIEEAPTLEGQWVFQSSWAKREIGKHVSFTRSGNDYILVSENSGCPTVILRGGPTEFYGSFTADSTCLIHMYTPEKDSFREILQQLSGKITYNERITLSQDGNSATYAIDDIHIYTWEPSGLFQKIETNPLGNVSILSRVTSR